MPLVDILEFMSDDGDLLSGCTSIKSCCVAYFEIFEYPNGDMSA